MDTATLNRKLSLGEIEVSSMLPHVAQLAELPFVFDVDFGLKALPLEPGILVIRGARQYGKSTWLEQELYKTIKTFGPGSAYYLNGEEILSVSGLEERLEELLPAFSTAAQVQRIFIDEITAIPQWELALKKMADQGKLANILVVTTGSQATDLRRGIERLPGRKGKLARTNYLFTPVSYGEFYKKCGKMLGKESIYAYLLSGGSPIACSELAINRKIPEYVIELVRDWVDGELVRSGRGRAALANIVTVLFRLGGSPVGQAKLAREAGLANNTVAAGYIDVLSDLGCVIPAYPWDQHKKISILRKPCKYHFTNLLVAVAYSKARIRTTTDFLALPDAEQGLWYEWLVAQELLRRASIGGDRILMPFNFWQNSEHEIDFVDVAENFFEVKRGACSVLEFSWFERQFPGEKLTVINKQKFAAQNVQGVLLDEFMRGE